MTSNNDAQAQGEDLRLQGNDAYKLNDFERALELYQKSVDHFPRANTLSNMTAVLHKLGRYEEAKQAADKATKVDPKWAKGWWRLGLACELVKDFHLARGFYEKALQLDKQNQVFRQHLKQVKDRLLLLDQLKNGTWTKQQQQQQTPKTDLFDTAEMKAFVKVQKLADDGFLYNLSPRYVAMVREQGLQYPTSNQYLFCGIFKWIAGLKCAIADFSCGISPESMRFGEELKQRLFSGTLTGIHVEQANRLLGGVPNGDAMNNMISGFSHLQGRGVFIEMAPAKVCPQPKGLSRYIAFQILAQLGAIQKWIHVLQEREYDFGPDMKCAPAVIQAYNTFFKNLGAPPTVDIREKSEKCTPQEIVDYVKSQVDAGRQWQEGGLRSYCDIMYRGTVLYASVVRGMGQQFSSAHQFLKWAREFITLLDKEYNVTQDQSFDQRGNYFRPSLRIGIMLAELDLLLILRGDSINDGPYPIESCIELCLEISEMANNMTEAAHATYSYNEYAEAQDNVAYVRKPLTQAHSVLAVLLLELFQRLPKQEFAQIVERHNLWGKENEKECDPYALIAKHYHIAAENELPDSDNGSILWWAYGANLAQAGGQRTIGELRHAIRTAQANEECRDIYLFGENMQKNGEYESISKLTANYFEDKPDSFVFPKIILNGKQSTLKVEGGAIICDNFKQYQRNELKCLDEQRETARRMKIMDTSELEKTFGKVAPEA